MELTELQNIWIDYDKKLSENIRINREILRLALISKPQKHLNRIKLLAFIRVLSPMIFTGLILILQVQFQISLQFFIGLALFLPVYIITYIWDIKYYSFIRNVDISLPVITVKELIAKTEKYKIKTTRIRYLLMPFAMIGFLSMIIHEITFNWNFLSILPILLIILVFFLSLWFTFRVSIYERYRKLNSEIDELRKLQE